MPRKTDATNTRGYHFTYYRVDETKSISVPAGRCARCRRITDGFCDSCGAFTCENHTYLGEDELSYCPDCKSDNHRPLTTKEKRRIREAYAKHLPGQKV
jgi:hypothetical protein